MTVLYVTVPLVILVLIYAVVKLKKASAANAPLEPTAEFPHKTVILIDGMSCAHCTARLETALIEKGLKSKVNLEEKNAEILSKTPLNQAEMSLLIQDLGFTPVHFSVLK